MDQVLAEVLPQDKAAEVEKLQALFVVVNESDKPAREQFYVLKPERLFGGSNALTPAAIIKDWDFAGIPEDSDWRRGAMVGTALARQMVALSGRNDIDFEQWMRLDLEYIDNWSLWLDLKILLLTPLKVFRREGIHQPGHVTMEEYKGPPT